MTSTDQAQPANTFKSLASLFRKNDDVRQLITTRFIHNIKLKRGKLHFVCPVSSIVQQNNISNKDSAVIVMRRNPCYVTVILIYGRCYNIVTSQSPLTAIHQRYFVSIALH